MKRLLLLALIAALLFPITAKAESYKLLLKEANNIGEVLVPHTFRHR
tara:strand:- start:979 stop:1119 length:141 start_codon:yes stop_codon:yes gene_type:complete